MVKNVTRRQKHTFSKEEITDIVTAYESGASTNNLAEKYDCHRRTIANQLKKQGVTVTREKLDLGDAVQMYESGLTTKEIAEKYHMSDNAVSYRLKKAGVRMRTRWDYSQRS